MALIVQISALDSIQEFQTIVGVDKDGSCFAIHCVTDVQILAWDVTIALGDVFWFLGQNLLMVEMLFELEESVEVFGLNASLLSLILNFHLI